MKPVSHALFRIDSATPLSVIASHRIIHLPPESTLLEAVRLLARLRISSLLILDDDRRPLGILNEQRLLRSFIVAPDALVEGWPVADARSMLPADLDALLALAPELVLLGTGATQVFPPAAVLATCLQRGIGLEVMTNAAAARTYSVLAGEGRRVAGHVFQELLRGALHLRFGGEVRDEGGALDVVGQAAGVLEQLGHSDVPPRRRQVRQQRADPVG